MASLTPEEFAAKAAAHASAAADHAETAAEFAKDVRALKGEVEKLRKELERNNRRAWIIRATAALVVVVMLAWALRIGVRIEAVEIADRSACRSRHIVSETLEAILIEALAGSRGQDSIEFFERSIERVRLIDCRVEGDADAG